jgi:hypothetical protein
MNTHQRPSPLRIIQNDYLAFMAAVLPLAVWIVFFFGSIGQSTNSLYFGIALTLGSIALLAWRIFFFTKLFENGEETTAVVQGIYFRRSRGTVNFTYTYQGANYSADNLTTTIGHTRKLETGQEVTILVNPSNPERAIIKTLFT